MTLDEAISHALEVAEHNDNLIRWGCINESVIHNCRECAAEHRQLAEWLTELKELRSIVEACNILAVDAFAVEKLCKELKEAKRLLKMAVEDISKMPCNNDTHSPDSCYICVKHGNCSYADSFKWCRADIALKLIGETNDEP